MTKGQARSSKKTAPELTQGVADAQALLASLKEKLTSWSEKIDKTAANIEQASRTPRTVAGQSRHQPGRGQCRGHQ